MNNNNSNTAIPAKNFESNLIEKNNKTNKNNPPINNQKQNNNENFSNNNNNFASSLYAVQNSPGLFNENFKTGQYSINEKNYYSTNQYNTNANLVKK